MGPFVPDIITDELNLIVALFLGILFGIVLEQAGFSSSRRLAGVFYGYDFTVLRVFFTAGVTAMLGVIFLGALGYLDTDIIYVNPTFLGPAIVGGVIMGFGFILGGYCPGTSICAAAIGKKDAIVFIAGGIAGVFLFGELFPLYDQFYISGAMGPLKVFAPLGISQGAFALGMIVMAVAAFIATTRIEKKVRADSPFFRWPKKLHLAAGAALLAFGLVAFVTPDRKTSILREVESPAYQQEHPLRTMSIDELAFRVLDRDPRLVIIDVRPPDQFAAMPLPGSSNIMRDGIFGRENAGILGLRHRDHVFIDQDGSSAATAARVAMRLGYENIRVVEGGMNAVKSEILDFKAPAGKPPEQLEDAERFRARASVELSRMIGENKTTGSKPKAATKKISGGC